MDTWIWYSFGSWNHLYHTVPGVHALADRIPTSGPIVVPSSPAWQMLLKIWLKPRCCEFWSPLQAVFFGGLHGVGMLCKGSRCYAAAKRFQKLGGIIEYHMFPNIFVYTLHTVSQSQEDEHQLYKIGMILKFKSRHFSLSQFVKIWSIFIHFYPNQTGSQCGECV